MELLPTSLADALTPMLHVAKTAADRIRQNIGDVDAVEQSRLKWHTTKPSTRADFLRTLAEVIGAPPAPDAAGRIPWRQEFELLNLLTDTELASGCDEGFAPQALGFASPAELSNYLGTSEGGEFLETRGLTLERTLAREQSNVDVLVERGWDSENAISFTLLFQHRRVLARDLRGKEAPSFPASNFAVCEALYATAVKEEEVRRKAQTSHRGVTKSRYYKHLEGVNSLSSADRAWADLVEPDRTGFRGLSSSSLVIASRNPLCFTEDGYRNATDEGMVLMRDATTGRASDVVCFEGGAGEDDDLMMHEPVRIDELNAALPPNTLFRLKRIHEPGTWEVDGVASAPAPEVREHPPRGAKTMGRGRSSRQSHTAPGITSELEPAKVRPNCRLLVVSVTFKKPREASNEAARLRSGAKLCGAVHTLRYANRATYVHGLDDILANPVLTMQEEWQRGSIFVDWRGCRHDCLELWRYVNGPAKSLDQSAMGPGVRDEAHDGKTPEMFRAEVNANVRARRAAILDSANATGGVQRESDPHWKMLEAGEPSELTLDEVLAVRLYSGPGFQPINEFLREIGHLTGKYRVALAAHRDVTFAATTSLLCSAVRKLADVTWDPGVAPRSVPLYRAVRGELPPAFWDLDSQGMISAVDSAFMSTSRNPSTPIQYMDTEVNVLWELRSSEPGDDAYHCGADISLLSQYRHEDEVLFPPCTMLIVEASAASHVRAATAVSNASNSPNPIRRERSVNRMLNMSEYATDEHEPNSGKSWKRIRVRPCFV